MGDLLDALSDAMIAAAAQPWALAALFAMCAIDGFFPVVPSESLVVAMASVSMHAGNAPWWGIFLLGATGALAGDVAAYFIGRHVPLERFPWFRRGRGKSLLESAHRQLHAHTGLFLLTARYIPVGRVAINMAAGATGFPLPRFLRFDTVAVIAWAGYNTAIGATAGHLFDNAIVAIAVGIAGGLLIGFVVDRIARRFAGSTAQA